MRAVTRHVLFYSQPVHQPRTDDNIELSPRVMAQVSRDSSSPTLHQLQQPEKLKTVLEEDSPDDCLSCKLLGSPPPSLMEDAAFKVALLTKTYNTGASAFIGLGTYSYFSGKHQLRLQQTAILKSKSRFGIQSRQAGITTIAAALVGMGFWRLLN